MVHSWTVTEDWIDMADSVRRENSWGYAIIVGHGGSGTKRLLRILDQSPLTHCRNEPDRLPGSPLFRLKGGEKRYGWAQTAESEQMLEFGWDAAVAWARERVGSLDFMVPAHKGHIYRISDILELKRITGSARARRWLGHVTPELQGDEWQLPRWLGSNESMQRAFLVMKLNQVPAFSPWVLAHRPHVKVIHIVRHPAGYFNSWWVRHVAQRDADQVRKSNLERIRIIVERLPEWAERFGDFESASLERLEMLFWLYATKLTHDAGNGHAQYLRVLDEEVVQDPFSTARRVYAECGCAFTPLTEQWLQAASGSWREGSLNWRDLIETRWVETVEEILEVSGFASWWEANQSVSGIRYDLSRDLNLWAGLRHFNQKR